MKLYRWRNLCAICHFNTLAVILLMLFLLVACGGNDEPELPASEAQSSVSRATKIPTATPTESIATVTNIAQADTQNAANSATPLPTELAVAVAGGEQNTTQHNESNSSVLPADPMAAVIQALQQQQLVGRYRLRETTITNSGRSRMVAEIILPDHVHYLAEFSGQKFEYIIMAEQVWMRIENQWMAGPANGALLLRQINDSEAVEFAQIADNVHYVGIEILDGQEAMVYTYTIDMNKSSLMKLDSQRWVKLWVSPVSGLPIKQEIASEVAKAKSRTTRVIEYDDTIQIEEPVVP